MGNVTCAQCSKLTANHAICDECFAKAEKLQGHLDSEQRQSARRIREMLEENARLETIVEDRNKRVAEVNARIAEWDRLLRASVPERWKNCTSSAKSTPYGPQA